jgi:hypothetical protein
MMHTDLITNEDGQRTQVGPDPLDYVLRYAVGDYDCYHHGRYIGSRPTLPKAIAAVEEEQAKVARHRQLAPAAGGSIATYEDELRAIAARLHALANRLTSHPTERVLLHTHLTLAHIRISQALKNVQDAECSCALAEHAPDQTCRSMRRPDSEERDRTRQSAYDDPTNYRPGALAVLPGGRANHDP